LRRRGPCPGFRKEAVIRMRPIDLELMPAAGVVADNPVDLTLGHRLPKVLDVLPGTNRRIHLRQASTRRVYVEQEVSDRNLAPEVDMRERRLHRDRGLHRLAAAEMEQVDVDAFRLMSEIRRDADRQSFRM